MIDWISATLPFDWDVPINGGAMVHYRPDGSVEWGTHKTLHLHGSHDARFSIRSVERGKVEIAGNPAKFLQGHNLFGTDDLCGLVVGLMDRLCALIELEPSEVNRAAWIAGDWGLSRVDCTAMYSLPTFTDVRSWLQAAGSAASVKWRGRGHYQDGTLYFGKVAKGKRASPWQLKLYHKGAEILVPGHQLAETLPQRERLIEWASDKLRIEVTLRTQELKRLGLQTARNWRLDTSGRIHGAYLAKMEIGELQTIDAKTEEDLKPRLRAVYALWKTGADVRSIYQPRTFYRMRRDILEVTGADIGTLCPTSNVVPLRRVLEAKPATVPLWARDLMFEPERMSA